MTDFLNPHKNKFKNPSADVQRWVNATEQTFNKSPFILPQENMGCQCHIMACIMDEKRLDVMLNALGGISGLPAVCHVSLSLHIIKTGEVHNEQFCLIYDRHLQGQAG